MNNFRGTSDTKISSCFKTIQNNYNDSSQRIKDDGE